MTNYDDMSDFQINKAVAEAQGFNAYHLEDKDYCNNPSDMWPIIVEHNILIRPRPETDIGEPFASDIRGIHVTRCIDNNGLLRAAAIVYLKMEEAKNAHIS